VAVVDRPGPEAEPIEDLEQLRESIEALRAANRSGRDAGTERRLLRALNHAGIRLLESAPEHPQFVAADEANLPSADDGLPEFTSGQLTAGLLRAGILRDGCVLVRGLVPRERALRFAADIDQAFAEREHSESGAAATPGYYEEFEPHPQMGAEIMRPWIKQGGGLLAADSPKLSFEMLEMFHAAGLPELVSHYLGETALISAHKTTLRKADPSVAGAWHQDGYFMGEVRSLNLWLSLSRCGDEAPGLDIVARRFDSYLATATDEAILDYTISQRKVEEAAGETPVIRPIFEPGDALLFDELFLHQTGSDPSMPNPRFAIENWFFGASAFPEEYAPVAV
jgi:hypothetical protein